jgi:phosphatidylserine/phosphatidylglycerophosphate/cardiolipin synthase-like enzyme
VSVVAVLHRDVNREALLQAWRDGVPRPRIFTWPGGADEKSAVHAKLLIADRNDALVTSANLTYHGFERNLEMGIRVTGHAAAEIYDGVYGLIETGDLVPWDI